MQNAALLRRYRGNKEAQVDKCAQQVWIDLPPHTMAGYLHCCRILQNVVEQKADNE
jgi:hypothetical protein